MIRFPDHCFVPVVSGIARMQDMRIKLVAAVGGAKLSLISRRFSTLRFSSALSSVAHPTPPSCPPCNRPQLQCSAKSRTAKAVAYYAGRAAKAPKPVLRFPPLQSFPPYPSSDSFAKGDILRSSPSPFLLFAWPFLLFPSANSGKALIAAHYRCGNARRLRRPLNSSLMRLCSYRVAFRSHGFYKPSAKYGIARLARWPIIGTFYITTSILFCVRILGAVWRGLTASVHASIKFLAVHQRREVIYFVHVNLCLGEATLFGVFILCVAGYLRISWVEEVWVRVLII